MKRFSSSLSLSLAYPNRLTMWNSGGMCFLASERGTSWSWYRALWSVFCFEVGGGDKVVEVEKKKAAPSFGQQSRSRKESKIYSRCFSLSHTRSPHSCPTLHDIEETHLPVNIHGASP